MASRLGGARGMVVVGDHLADAVAEPDALGARGSGGEEHLGAPSSASTPRGSGARRPRRSRCRAGRRARPGSSASWTSAARRRRPTAWAAAARRRCRISWPCFPLSVYVTMVPAPAIGSGSQTGIVIKYPFIETLGTLRLAASGTKLISRRVARSPSARRSSVRVEGRRPPALAARAHDSLAGIHALRPVRRRVRPSVLRLPHHAHVSPR